MRGQTFWCLLGVFPIGLGFSFQSANRCAFTTTRPEGKIVALRSTEPESGIDDIEFESSEEKAKVIGNLVADDEWQGLGWELAETIRVAVIEDAKKNTRDFIGKDDYKVGDISKEIDSRVKDEIAKLRGKDEYELGDFILAMDQMSKSMTEELTGKPYEVGDLSVEIDRRIKDAVSNFTGKPYEAGDLLVEVDKRVRDRVASFTGKEEYKFGDIAREIEARREKWARDYLGEEAAANYQFGDLTKKALSDFTGKDEYQFGDVTKKIMGDLFGGRKRKSKE